MEKEIKFKNLDELYIRILPALKSVVKEFNKKGYSYIHEEDVWNYLTKYKWTNTYNLDLGDMVNDILHIECEQLNDYVKSKIKNLRRDIEQGEI